MRRPCGRTCCAPRSRPTCRKAAPPGPRSGRRASPAVRLRAAEEAFDFVAARSAATGYLCGSRFSLADLCAASTLAVLVGPPDSPMACPAPVASGFAALMQRHAAHPGAAWVRRLYAQHRGARQHFDGPSPA